MKRRDDGGRGDLTDDQWTKLKHELPPQKARTGKPAHDHVDSQHLVGSPNWCPARDIPERYGNHRTIPAGSTGGEKPATAWSRMRRRCSRKIDWKCILWMVRLARTSMQLVLRGTHKRRLWAQHSFSTKVHIKAEGFGKPMHFVLTGGERHETVAFPELAR